MATPPIWAQHNAVQTFKLVSFDRAGVVQRVANEFTGPLTARRFKRAVLAVRNSKIIEKRPGMLVGWRRTFLGELEAGVDASIALTGFVPHWHANEAGFISQNLGIIIHRHALARLFERAIQPLDSVAAELLSSKFIGHCTNSDQGIDVPGFAVPFRSGRFVGFVEYVRDLDKNLLTVFGIRSWLPEELATPIWTKKSSRSRQKAIEYDRDQRIISASRFEV